MPEILHQKPRQRNSIQAKVLKHRGTGEGGRLAEALVLKQGGVIHSPVLATVDPDGFLPDLALCLNNLSIRSAELGRLEEALARVEEAVSHYRTLATVDPDGFLPDLALCLNN